MSRPSGLSPRTVKSVYGFSTSEKAGKGQTVAIVIPFHHPNVEAHLRAFSKQFDLPQCRSLNGNPLLVGGCFQQAYASGVEPPTNDFWAEEADLDVQWVHAIAPGAKIVLVEAASANLADLFLATAFAGVLPGVRYVSISWGTTEFLGEDSFDVFFQQPGLTYFAASGDGGASVYPSASSYVISVGGTTLKVRDNKRRSETAWANSGGGCSAYIAANAAQASFVQYGQTGCNGFSTPGVPARSTPDLVAVGDPQTGVSVFTTDQGRTGWYILGGTSASSPIVAGWAATTGQQVNASFIYGFGVNFFTRFFDITAGQPSCLVGFDTCSGRGSFTRGRRDD